MIIRRYRDIRNIPEIVFDYLLRNVTLGSSGAMERNARSFRDSTKGVFPVSVAFNDEDTPVGWALWDDWDKVEMFVVPQFRRQGVATKLVLELARILEKAPGALDVYNYAAERVQRAAERQYQTGG